MQQWQCYDFRSPVLSPWFLAVNHLAHISCCSNVYFSIPSLGVTCSNVLPLLRLLVNASTFGNVADVHMPSITPKRFHLSIHPSIHPSKYCSHCDSLAVADQRHHMAATCTAISAKSVNRQRRPLQPLLALSPSHHAPFHHHLLPSIYFYSLTTTAPHSFDAHI